MPDLVHWSAFFAASIVLLLIPGPSVMYVVTRGIEQGYGGVVFSAIGLALGDLIQVFGTVIGISALLVASTVMFGVVKYAGAAYLVALGSYRLARRQTSLPFVQAVERSGRETSGSLVMQAFLALNPKTAVFFLALLPQFVAENAGPAWFQILLFGCAFVLLGFVTNSLYGFLGGILSAVGKESNRFRVATHYISNFFLIGMGIAAALTPAPHKPA